MQIFLQQIATGYFLTETGDWTDNKEEARDFEHFVEALQYCREHFEGPIGAYCAFRDPLYDFSLCLNLAGHPDMVELERKVQTLERLCEAPSRDDVPVSRKVRPARRAKDLPSASSERWRF
jgi:hypothetical protein